MFGTMLYFENPSPSLEHRTPASKAISLHTFELCFITQQWLLNLSISERFQLFFPLKKEKKKKVLWHMVTLKLFGIKKSSIIK